MKTAILSVATLAVLVAAFYFHRKRDDRILFTDFSWGVSGKSAPFSFPVRNRIDESLTVIVLVEAYHVGQSDTPVSQMLIGSRKLEVLLRPKEAKKIEDKVPLSRFGSSETRVSYQLTIKEPNKAPEPTTRPVTIRAEPRIAPVRVVAHL